MKDIPGIRKYVSVDGGMTDNLRPALYNARYEAMLANRANDENEELVSIAGKCCESGDMLIWDIHLPKVAASDLLAVSVQEHTGTRWRIITIEFEDQPLSLQKAEHRK